MMRNAKPIDKEMQDPCSCESIVCSIEDGTCNVVKDRFLYPRVPFAPRNVVAQLCEPSCAFVAQRPSNGAPPPIGDVSAFLDSVLVQGVRIYVQKGNTLMVPRFVPFKLPSVIDCVAHSELGRRTHLQSLLWLYNLTPHRTYGLVFGSYRYQKPADEYGRLFPFDKHPFPIGKYALHVDGHDSGGGGSNRNTFLSTRPTAISQTTDARQIDTSTLLHKQLELHAPSTRIMCAVSHEEYYTPDQFVVHEANGEWFLL
jgi:hypothetical protein